MPSSELTHELTSPPPFPKPWLSLGRPVLCLDGVLRLLTRRNTPGCRQQQGTPGGVVLLRPPGSPELTAQQLARFHTGMGHNRESQSLARPSPPAPQPSHHAPQVGDPAPPALPDCP